MKSIITFLIAGLFSLSLLNANPVSQEVAQKTAILWYADIANTSVSDLSIVDAFTLTEDNLVTLYVFNFKSGGFVIVAADDASIPILGYSANNSFPEDMSCPAVKEYMENYSRQIEQIVNEGLSNKKTKAQWIEIQNGIFTAHNTKDVEPLLTTTWWQGCYYNELCPIDSVATNLCYHAATGCVATAMAQIMKYHNFPPQGVGSHSYPHPLYGAQSVDFGNTTYDWASMPDNVTASNTPVATIMYHAGVSVNMNYGANGSATYSENVPKAFIDNFNYNPELQIQYFSDYTNPDDWKTLIRADLDEQLPVYYSGMGPNGGHAFVCDGYHLNDDHFHFNWGWGGNADGWFSIGSLNPAGMTFNQYTTAIFQLKPGNPNLAVRVVNPITDALVYIGNPVNIEVAAEIGNPEQMKINIDGETVAAGNSNSLEFTWSTTIEDCGSHEVSAWAFNGNDSVFHRINLNISQDWTEQSTGFQTPLRLTSYISAVDSNIAWAIPRDGINEWGTGIQEFTHTNDGGVTWSSGTMSNCEGLRCGMVCAISDMKAYIPMFRISGTKQIGIYVTIDGGSTWNRQPTAFFSMYSFPDCIHFFNENDGWCMGDAIPQSGSFEFEIYTTTDGGENWIAVPAENKPNPISTSEWAMLSYSAVNDTIWFGTTKGRVYKSVDKGNNWTVAAVPGMEGQWITPVFRNGSHGLVHNFFGQNTLMVNGPGAICETFDGGETWAPVITQGPLYWTDIAFVPGTDNTWVSTGGHFAFGHGASYSTDGGHTWTAFPGTEGTKFRQMAWINPHCGWAGSYNISTTEGGIYKFIGDLSSLTTSVTKQNYQYDNLMEVYPNPFSNQTSIEFILPESEFATLSIYDITGKHIETILSKKLSKGNHKINWNAEGLNEGIYFIRLKTNNGIRTIKMIKLK